MLCQVTEPDKIRHITGLSEEQQKIYRQLFLDLEDRRDDTAFIVSQLLTGGNLCEAIPESLYDFNHKEYIDLYRLFRVIGFYTTPLFIEFLFTGDVSALQLRKILQRFEISLDTGKDDKEGMLAFRLCVRRTSLRSSLEDCCSQSLDEKMIAWTLDRDILSGKGTEPESLLYLDAVMKQLEKMTRKY
jgi:hypothetical protein